MLIPMPVWSALHILITFIPSFVETEASDAFEYLSNIDMFSFSFLYYVDIIKYLVCKNHTIVNIFNSYYSEYIKIRNKHS